VDDDPWEVFDAGPVHRPAPGPGHRVTDRRADVVFVFSGKGGVGKTSVALGLAQRAGTRLRVVLVDANRGQGDIRTYLRLARSTLPTIWAAATAGDPARAIVPPEVVNAARHQRLQDLTFGLVMAPHGDQVDPRTVTPAAYRSVLDAAACRADLVVVDTQIVEDGVDTTGLIDELLIPSLRAGGWAVAVADTSSAGLTNTLERVRALHAAGIPPDRLMSVLSRVPAGFTDRQITAVAELFGRHTTFLGHVPDSAALQSAINLGRIEHADPGLSGVLDAALLRVTGDPAYQPAAAPGRPRRWPLRIGRRR
jgi:cellulose biosynthesis protein BcsQ